jgi:hypothetical protein
VRRRFVDIAIVGVATALLGCVSPRDVPEPRESSPIDGSSGPDPQDAPTAAPSDATAESSSSGDALTKPPTQGGKDAALPIDQSQAAPGGCGADQRACATGCVARGSCCPEDQCSIPNGQGACIDGTCRKTSCNDGFDDCDPGQPGCETNLNDHDHCGSCLKACAKDQMCKQGACACPIATCASGCADTASDPRNCGACDRVCAGACSGGACACPSPNPQNLVRNGGFDSDVAGWNFETPLTSARSSVDASSCSGSGSASFTYPLPKNGYQADVVQCLPGVTPGVRYHFGAWFQVRGNLPELGDLQVALQWHTQPGCGYVAGVTPPAEFAHGAFVEALDKWLLIDGESVAPDGTRSAELRLIINPGDSSKPLQGSVDMAFVAPSPSGW